MIDCHKRPVSICKFLFLLASLCFNFNGVCFFSSSLFANAQGLPPKKAGYTICNGMSNQLLGHFAALSFALDGKTSIDMPDAYIINGVQTIIDGNMADVTPTLQNSVPIGKIFDIEKIREMIKTANENADVNVVPFDASLSCSGWLNRMKTTSPKAVREAIRYIAPSPLLQAVIDKGLKNMGPSALENGVCLHHRDGPDWHEHCKVWENIPDGVWRKNCLEQDGNEIGKLVKDRLLEEDANGNKITSRVLYYVGDHDPPTQHLSTYGFEVISRADIIGEEGERSILDMLLGDRTHSLSREQYIETYRDLWAVIDFFTCLEMKSFVGNSVSSWSDLQLAARNGYGNWYNSRSIPLAQLLPIFPIPIVYTYTEHSHLLGKIMLKVSILSVRTNMGGTQPIHILYMGKDDVEFMGWLNFHNVVVHAHEPKWIDSIETMRLAGDLKKSHLFAHAGNYLGTWQRIDIPDLIESEYILYLDADTVVTKEFSLADFGLEITPTISFAIESEHTTIPFNAGVALMNIPCLRETKSGFLKFIEGQKKRPLSAPSDQGAYLDFYHPGLLDRAFNIKSYFNDMKGRKILHFHGPKPFEIFQYMIGQRISPLMTGVLHRAKSMESPCSALIAFSRVASTESGLIPQYCTGAFSSDPIIRLACINFFERLHLLKSTKECELAGTIELNNARRQLIDEGVGHSAEVGNFLRDGTTELNSARRQLIDQGAGHSAEVRNFLFAFLLCFGLLHLKSLKFILRALKVKASKMLTKCTEGERHGKIHSF